MTPTVYNKTIGLADAGLQARASVIARAFGMGETLPTFRLLRS